MMSYGLPQRSNNSTPSIYSSDDDEGMMARRVVGGGTGASSLSEALRNSDAGGGGGGGDFVVGSLPMHMRRPARRENGAGANRSFNNGNNGSSSNNCFAGGRPMSLPVHLNAPFLSSRDGPRDKLSSMPEFALPESSSPNAASSPAVQYGSLRESRMHRLRARRGGDDATESKMMSSFGPDGSNAEANNVAPRESLLGRSLGGGGAVNYVDGITRGVDEFTLNNAAEDAGRRRRVEVADGWGSESQTSRSLTALEILTNVRNNAKTTHGASAGVGGSPASKAAGRDEFSRRNWSGGPPHDAGPTPPELSTADDAGDGSSDSDDANPDTFEAFDFQLDE